MKYSFYQDTHTSAADAKEHVRVRAWHATFNAAVSGLACYMNTPDEASRIVAIATAVADAAHGVL